MSSVFEDSEKYEYTTSNAIFNILNQTVDFVNQPNCNLVCNISSKENDAILLSEGYFMVEYTINTGVNFRLIPSFFLSFINSFNLAINSFSMQYNTIFAARSLPMLSQTLRYLQYEDKDFNQLNSIQREIFQNTIQTDGAVGLRGFVNSNLIKYYPIETYAAAAGVSRKNYCVIHLKDIFPSVGQFQQVNGLLSMSLVLSYNSLLQAMGSQAPISFQLTMINFHYPVRTFNMKNSIDLDLNYLSTYGILNGSIPNEYTIDYAINTPFNFGEKVTEVTMSNIQLSVNKIYKLLIFPVFTPTAAAGALDMTYYINNTPYNITPAAADITAASLTNENLLSNLYGLSTPVGSVGSPLYSYSQIKVVVNGSVIKPTNVVQPYSSPYYSDWYNYNFSFNGDSIDKIKKPDLFFSANMYKFFKPIIVDLSNATSNNSFNSLSFSFNVFNQFSKTAVGSLTHKLRVDYVILNEVVLNDS